MVTSITSVGFFLLELMRTVGPSEQLELVQLVAEAGKKIDIQDMILGYVIANFFDLHN